MKHLTCILLMCTLALPVSGLVVCVGSGGHVAVEASHDVDPCEVAEAHVLELAARGEVTALNSEGQGIGERLAAVGMTPEVAGSLVSGGYTNFENALASWKANPVQRSRLLIEGAKEVGFGVVSDRTSTYGIYMELIITGDES